MTIVNYPEFLQTQAYPASRVRFQQEDFTANGEGVLGQSDFRVSQRGAGANMSVDVAAGSAVVRGDTIARQGLYHVVNDAAINAAITSNASGNPRIDRVTLQCSDSYDSASGTDISVINVLAGVASAGATLDNLNGAVNIPNNQLHLADVLVANGAASIADASIRSRRAFAKPLIPPLVGLTDKDMVPLLPPFGAIGTGQIQTLTGFQSAALVQLPRRIVNATKLNWRYLQGATAATGNYILALYDASGRALTATASTAFTGSTGTYQVRSETITPTSTLEAGWYYLFMGTAIATGSATVTYQGIGVPGSTGAEATAGMGAAFPGYFLRNTSGGVTLPAGNTLLGMTDVGTQTTQQSVPGVPLCSLSVG